MTPASFEFLTAFHAENYRRAKQAAISQKNDAFPAPCVVRINSAKFKGIGIVYSENDAIPIEIGALLENGNVWSYPIEDCSRIDNRSEWPEWVRQWFEGSVIQPR